VGSEEFEAMASGSLCAVRLGRYSQVSMIAIVPPRRHGNAQRNTAPFEFALGAVQAGQLALFWCSDQRRWVVSGIVPSVIPNTVSDFRHPPSKTNRDKGQFICCQRHDALRGFEA
jgi:hypothetical protein